MSYVPYHRHPKYEIEPPGCLELLGQLIAAVLFIFFVCGIIDLVEQHGRTQAICVPLGYPDAQVRGIDPVRWEDDYCVRMEDGTKILISVPDVLKARGYDGH
jgi:hypothetical protein